MSATGNGGFCPIRPDQIAVLQVQFSDWQSAESIQLELPSDEQQRAALFQNPDAKKRYVICRWVLRQALRQLGDPNWNDPFLVRNGKPYQTNGLQFNISHTTDWGVIGLCNGYPIGVDIEEMKPRSNLVRLADQVFSQPEVDTLSQLSPADQASFFYSVWTQKEAIVKAVAGSIYRAKDLTVLPLCLDWRRVRYGSTTLWVRNVQAPNGHQLALAVQTR